MALVLIVEDNAVNRDVLGRRLEKQGFTVEFANDGPAGVAAAAELKPDIILMDMGLGEMDGFEATRQIKENSLTAAIPVIAVTASVFDSDRKRAIEAGCVGFETKPVDLPRLLEKIEFHLSARK